MIRVCRAADVPDGQARGFTVEGLELLIARRGCALYAYLNSCPHRGTSLDWAPDRFMSPDLQHLQCATHGALFRVENGQCVLGPCLGETLTSQRIECVDGDVWLVR